jgi:hypothetical protein
MSDDTAKSPTGFPGSVYPEGIEALREHLKYGVNLPSFEELSMPRLVRWISSLLEFNGQRCISIKEVIFRLHFEACDSVGIKCREVFCWQAINLLCFLGNSRPQAVYLYENTVEKLASAGLLCGNCYFVRGPMRKGWRRNIPGLSRVKVFSTTVNNPKNLSFEEMLALVKATEE